MLPSQFSKITAEGVRGLILARLDTGSQNWINNLAMRMQSNQASEEYAWLGTSPELREFIGGRTAKELKENSFTITNKDYETSLRIKSKDMRRDKFGMINVRVNQLADRALDHPGALLSTLIMDGESNVCYDGQFFFDIDHSEGQSGTQSNDISASASTPASPTTAEMSAGIMDAITAMIGFKDDSGAPMNQSAKSFVVMVPTSLLEPALMAVTALLGDAGVSATIPALRDYFNVTVVPNPRLTWTTKIAVFRIDEAAKPFILQEEEIPDVVALGEGSEYEQLNKEQLFGIDWSGNTGYGYWQYSCLVTFA